jgi:hypothetical protein
LNLKKKMRFDHKELTELIRLFIDDLLDCEHFQIEAEGQKPETLVYIADELPCGYEGDWDTVLMHRRVVNSIARYGYNFKVTAHHAMQGNALISYLTCKLEGDKLVLDAFEHDGTPYSYRRELRAVQYESAEAEEKEWDEEWEEEVTEQETEKEAELRYKRQQEWLAKIYAEEAGQDFI